MAAVCVMGTGSSGCGTLLYPERRGQPAGRLDWKVVLLDGIGLFFFFIPGVIAFAVDFINGTIYLPQDGANCEPLTQSPTSKRNRGALRKIPVSRDELTPGGIERIIAKETGKKIILEEGEYVAERLENIDEFWEARSSVEGHIIRGAVS